MLLSPSFSLPPEVLQLAAPRRSTTPAFHVLLAPCRASCKRRCPAASTGASLTRRQGRQSRGLWGGGGAVGGAVGRGGGEGLRSWQSGAPGGGLWRWSATLRAPGGCRVSCSPIRVPCVSRSRGLCGQGGGTQRLPANLHHVRLRQPPSPALGSMQGRPPGVLGLWPSRAVTFLENHDTGEGVVCRGCVGVVQGLRHRCSCCVQGLCAGGCVRAYSSSKHCAAVAGPAPWLL